jgi:pimeloyl-ACP methyl ester carboxylesterase
MKKILPLILLAISFAANAQIRFIEPASDKPIANRGSVQSITATIPFQGYEEDQALLGQGEYEIFLDLFDGVLDRPVIVLDGFDPGDSRDIAGLYNRLEFGGENLADQVREEGYDVVILNAPQYNTEGVDIDGGADYIQRNAFVLVALIQELIAQKEGDEQLVVLGPSMGGLIAQYALAYMEANDLDHQTRLFISFDAPHRGANIPISLQYLVNVLAREIGDPSAEAVIDQVLNSAAAREMLVDHYLGHLEEGSETAQDPSKLLPAGAPGFRDEFQAELDALGFPTQVRNVAMINGSGDGTGTGTPGMQVISTTLDLGAGVSANIDLNFTPEASQINQVTFFEGLFNGVPLFDFAADAESFSFTDGVDAAPGGTSMISSALGDGGGSPVLEDFIEALDQDLFCFIPTISALAISNEDDWYASPDIGATHDSPFVNFYIPDTNEDHVTVTEESAAFALDEILEDILGLTQNDLNTWVLAPNPVGAVLQLKWSRPLNDNAEVRIYDLSGREIELIKVAEGSTDLSWSHGLASGYYLIEIEQNGNRSSEQFLVR